MIKSLASLIILALLFSSCTVGPAEVNYGKDGCSYCKMTIVDRQHAAEIVTVKGKSIKYDAIECMINDIKSKKAEDIHMYLVNDYTSPGEFIPVESTTFLISEGIPSPMGAFLSGFSSKEAAQAVIEEQGGTIHTWETVKKEIK
jgi:copper chaperone NosL